MLAACILAASQRMKGAHQSLVLRPHVNEKVASISGPTSHQQGNKCMGMRAHTFAAHTRESAILLRDVAATNA